MKRLGSKARTGTWKQAAEQAAANPDLKVGRRLTPCQRARKQAEDDAAQRRQKHEEQENRIKAVNRF